MISTLLCAITLAASPLLPLHTSGKNLVDTNGKTVQLHGINLGGWFVEEIWMTPFQNAAKKGDPETIKDHVSLWGTIEKRLGNDAMLRIRNAYRTNWIQDSDFKRIHDAGLNHVRIPFLWSILQEPGGMGWLHKAVDMAKSHDLYVVLDMHGLPGGQSNEHHTGEANKNRLWFDVDNITKAEDAWTTVAKEFANEPAVAIYDLINEPMGAPNPAMLSIVYDRLIRAVRKVAPEKVVLVDDGYKGFETTIHPNVAGWRSVAFSLHFYNFDAKTPADHAKALNERIPKLQELQGNRNAPIYAGEWNVEPQGTPGATSGMIKGFDKAGFSWAMWTYKTMAVGGPMGQWGLFHYPGPADAINAFEDSEAAILGKIAKVRTENMEPATGLLPVFRG